MSRPGARGLTYPAGRRVRDDSRGLRGTMAHPGVTRAVLPFVLLLPEPKGLSLEELTEPGSGQPARLLHPVRPS